MSSSVGTEGQGCFRQFLVPTAVLLALLGNVVELHRGILATGGDVAKLSQS